jgi:predicted HTH transcriptional regulator
LEQYIRDLINEGEHQTLDFKFEISDSRKIARTICAFANTDGGTLLIGVKDNGKIAGIRTDEEFYMLEASAQMYCKPPVPFKTETWNIDGKQILEVTIEKSYDAIHSAPDKLGNWKVFIRAGDQNFLANSVLLKAWENKKRPKGVLIKFTEVETQLLEYLSSNQKITLSKFCKLCNIKKSKAVSILAKLVAIETIAIEFTDKQNYFYLKESPI